MIISGLYQTVDLYHVILHLILNLQLIFYSLHLFNCIFTFLDGLSKPIHAKLTYFEGLNKCWNALLNIRAQFEESSGEGEALSANQASTILFLNLTFLAIGIIIFSYLVVTSLY